MPPKNRKKAIRNSVVPIQGRGVQHENTAEIVGNSGNEFEHLAVEEEDMYVQTYFFSLFCST